MSARIHARFDAIEQIVKDGNERYLSLIQSVHAGLAAKIDSLRVQTCIQKKRPT